jgi:hypothetical protein
MMIAVNFSLVAALYSFTQLRTGFAGRHFGTA